MVLDGLLDFKRNRADAAQFPAHGDMRPVFSTVEGEEGFFDVGEQAFRGGEAGEPLGNGAAGDDFRHGGQGVQNVPPCVRLAGSVALGEEDDPLAGNHILRAALALGVYIVPPDESVPLRADGGGAAYGVEHGGVALMQLSGDGAGGDAGEGACGWRLGIDGHPVAVPFDDVENPLAERLGDGCPGEHGEEVAAAEGEDAGHDGNSRGTRIDDHAHIIGKFIFIAAVNIGNRLFGRISQGTGKFRRLEPRLVVAGDGGEGELIEAEGL